jgi:hypothetical protein
VEQSAPGGTGGAYFLDLDTANSNGLPTPICSIDAASRILTCTPPSGPADFYGCTGVETLELLNPTSYASTPGCVAATLTAIDAY